MALVGFQYEPVSLEINEFDQQNNPNTGEKLRKSQGVTE